MLLYIDDTYLTHFVVTLGQAHSTDGYCTNTNDGRNISKVIEHVSANIRASVNWNPNSKSNTWKQ